MNHDAEDAIEYLAHLRHLEGTEHTRPTEKSKRPTIEAPAATEDEKVATDFSMQELREMLASWDQPNDTEVVLLRETFYQVVRSHYWHMIENGSLPKKSSAVQILLGSIEVSLDDCAVAVNDYSHLEPHVGHTTIADRLFDDDFFERLDVCLPEWVTIDNELHYRINYKKHEVTFFVLHCFIEAQRHAQNELATFFGDDKTPDTPEEVTVILESALQVERATEALALMNDSLVSITKSKIVAHNLIDIQGAYVQKLVAQGILCLGDAEELFHELAADERALSRARKEAAREAASLSVQAESGNLDSPKRRASRFGDLAKSGSLKRKNSEDNLVEMAQQAALGESESVEVNDGEESVESPRELQHNTFLCG